LAADTPGKIGRHFVRDALLLAIEALKQAPNVEEPTAAETREGIERATAQSAAPFQEAAPTGGPAIFFKPTDVLGRVGTGTVDEIEYRFGEPHVFYLRSCQRQPSRQ
jgi:hypothetical protein